MGDAACGVYLTEQAPRERVHEDMEKVPVPLVPQYTVPVGDEPVTVALQCVFEPTTRAWGLHAIVRPELALTTRTGSTEREDSTRRRRATNV